MTDQKSDQPGGDGLPLDVRIQTARYTLFRLLRADAPHERLREEWSKLETLLDSPTRDGAEGAGDVRGLLERIRDFPHSETSSEQTMSQLAGTAIALLDAPRWTPKPAPDAMREAIQTVIDEMIVVATLEDDGNIPEWASENQAEIDKWQVRLADAIALSAPVPPADGASIEQLRVAIADGYNNGNQQYDECDALVRMRFDAAARSVLALRPSGTGAAEPVAEVEEFVSAGAALVEAFYRANAEKRKAVLAILTGATLPVQPGAGERDEIAGRVQCILANELGVDSDQEIIGAGPASFRIADRVLSGDWR